MDAGVQAHRREWRDGRMDAMAGGRKEGGTWDSNQRTNKENASMADLSLRIKNKKYRLKSGDVEFFFFQVPPPRHQL